MGSWHYVGILYSLFGLGRISYEASAKSILADFYPKSRAVTFAYLNFILGLAATCYSFMVSDLSEYVLAISALVPILLIVPGYYYALLMPSDT
mmetsp:Transcript_19636/g.25617  ORF Transcript_19636/g.25617 Transcript_19636/m.25617 type:complete len:93 (-) Transcript_19636:259-537(-)